MDFRGKQNSIFYTFVAFSVSSWTNGAQTTRSVCVFVCKKGGVMVKIRTPAGAERQGDLCCIRAGPGRADRRHGEGGAVIQAQSLRNASRDSPAIPEAGAHLSGMRYSELLTTSSNWTIFSYLSGSQLHRLQRASVRTEKA